MRQKYEVITYIGDYPVENQPYWDLRFTSKAEAIAHAKVQHEELKDARPERADDIYTVVQDTNGFAVNYILYQEQELTDRKLATKLADELAGIEKDV